MNVKVKVKVLAFVSLFVTYIEYQWDVRFVSMPLTKLWLKLSKSIVFRTAKANTDSYGKRQP